jgi:dephospho-CoA kinase
MQGKSPFVVILTGGIASGKTAVSDRFSELGIPVIDTDRIARELVQPGHAELKAIVQQFGEKILDDTGHLDRRELRERVFSDPESKKQLEDILHPAIRRVVKERVSAVEQAYCIVVVPLLVETGSYQWADRVLVVDVDEQTQISRVIERDNVSREQAQSALNAQTTRESRLAIANDVIKNSGSLQLLDKEVQSLHERYLLLTAHSANSGTDHSPLPSQ